MSWNPYNHQFFVHGDLLLFGSVNMVVCSPRGCRSYSIYQASQDILDIKKYIDSTDEITVFKSIFNTDSNLMMPGIKLP